VKATTDKRRAWANAQADADIYGFAWGEHLVVKRIADIPGRGKVLRIVAPGGYVEVYVTAKGGALHVSTSGNVRIHS